MDPRITETVEALRHANWVVETAQTPRPLPRAVAERHPEIPPLALHFITSLERCERGDVGHSAVV